MQRIALDGTPAARGRLYGSAAASRVHRCIASYRDLFELRAGLDWATAVAHARGFIDDIERFAPDSLAELHGIAEGANVPFDAILVLNCRSELMFAAARGRGEVPPGECTSFAVMPGANANGHMLIGQNWDWVPFAREVCVLLHVKREGKPSFTTIVEAGMLAKIGVNAAGLALCTNTLVSERDVQARGVPYHVMLRALLDADSVEAAAGILGSVERALSANYLVADKSGDAMNFETTAGGATQIHATRARDGIIVHANHFLAPEYSAIDAYIAKSPHSLTRLAEMRRGLQEGEALSVERLQAILRGHAYAPNGICSHPDPAAHPLYARCTVASFIADLTAGEFWFTDGPPCGGAYEKAAFPRAPRALAHTISTR